MSKTYRFECIDRDDETGMCSTTSVDYETECDMWSTYDGPMYKFFEFLKGCGFVFDLNTRIGVQTKDGEFESASDGY
jgi:hypothetical protein